VVGFLLLPHMLFAAVFPFGGSGVVKTPLENIIGIIGDIILLVIPVVVALALIFFFWGLAQFILNAGNEQKRTEGKGIMLWGIIALFVIVSVWGLVTVLQNTFRIDSSTSFKAPQL